jgi:hypothetical protein
MPLTGRAAGDHPKLIGRYRYRPLSWTGLAGYTTLGIAATLGPLAYGRMQAEQAVARYGPAITSRYLWPWYGLALFGLAVFTVLVLHRVWQTRRSVKVFTSGLRVDLSPARRLRWEQITGIAVGVRQRRIFGWPITTSYQARLYPTTGKSVRLGRGIENLPQLLTQIKAKLYPRLEKEHLARFAEGQWLPFGPLSVQAEALRWQTGRRTKPKIIRWEGVRQIDIRSGRLVVELHDHRPLRIPVERLPNIEILLQIVQIAVRQ